MLTSASASHGGPGQCIVAVQTCVGKGPNFESSEAVGDRPGQKPTNHRGPKSTFVRFGPKADKRGCMKFSFLRKMYFSTKNNTFRRLALAPQSFLEIGIVPMVGGTI
jgi:hypothetical protein